jgi:hypothetical protein
MYFFEFSKIFFNFNTIISEIFVLHGYFLWLN